MFVDMCMLVCLRSRTMQTRGKIIISDQLIDLEWCMLLLCIIDKRSRDWFVLAEYTGLNVFVFGICCADLFKIQSKHAQGISLPYGRSIIRVYSSYGALCTKMFPKLTGNV